MRYAIERYSEELVNEFIPLLEEHYDEIAKYKDIPLDPDWAAYRTMDLQRVLIVFTARDEETGALVGYGIFIVRTHLHYRGCLTAFQDIIFIKKERRGHGLDFISWCDERLREVGVKLVTQHIKATHNFGPALQRKLGYELMDHIYTRRL